MTDRNATIQQRLDSYRALSSLFFTLPDEPTVDAFKEVDLGFKAGASEGTRLLHAYFEGIKGRSSEDVMHELRKDRTYLMRGVGKQGARPPYESHYLSLPPQQVLLDLSRLYRREEYGFVITRTEQLDHIAMELGFMQMYCERELAVAKDDFDNLTLLRSQEAEFFRKHLGKWARLYAVEVASFARTDFYRAVAMLLMEFMDYESNFLAGYAGCDNEPS